MSPRDIGWFLFSCLLCISCTRHSPRKVSTNQSWVRWAIEKDPETLDWTLCTERSCFSQVALLMEGLTRVEENGSERKVLPNLAESWQTPSPTEILFKLKPGVTWSDGQPLDSSDFVLGWKRLLANCRKTPQAARLFPITNAKAFCEGRVPFSEVGIKARDAHSIALEFAAPQPFFPMTLSHPATWPVPSEQGRTGFGPTLGPYLLEKWVRGIELRYVRNPRYHGKPASVAGIDVRVVPSASRRIQLFQEGEADLAQDIPGSFSSQALSNPMLKNEPTPTVVALVFNTTKKPFNQLPVRNAFEQALERAEMLRLMHWPNTVADELVPTPGATRVSRTRTPQRPHVSYWSRQNATSGTVELPSQRLPPFRAIRKRDRGKPPGPMVEKHRCQSRHRQRRGRHAFDVAAPAKCGSFYDDTRTRAFLFAKSCQSSALEEQGF